MRKGLLIVEDLTGVRTNIRVRAESLYFFPIYEAESSRRAIQLWNENKESIGTVIIDLKLENSDIADGFNVLSHIRDDADTGNTEILIYSGELKDIEQIINAVRTRTLGIFKKPDDAQKLWERLEQTASRFGETPTEPVFTDEERKEMLAISNFAFPLLLIGPSGSGKSVKAREIARLSGCADDKTLVINSAGLIPTLADSQLFGSMRGAYNDASTKVGTMLAASGFTDDHLHSQKSLLKAESPKGYVAYKSPKKQWGAIILDEIATLHPVVQAKLLLVLEGEPMMPVGWNQSYGFLPNFRIIAATNQVKDLRDTFRRDLLRRLSTYILRCKEIHEEPDDKIVNIINRYSIEIRRNGRFLRKIKPTLTTEALKIILDKKAKKQLKGGIREVRSLIDRACIKSIERTKKDASEVVISMEDINSAWQFTEDNIYQLEEVEGAPTIDIPEKDIFPQEEIDAVRESISKLLDLESTRLNESSIKDAIKTKLRSGKNKDDLKNELRATIAYRYKGNKTWPGFALLGLAVGVERNDGETTEGYGLRVKRNSFDTPFRPEKGDSTE